MRVELASGILFESVILVWCVWIASMVLLTGAIQLAMRDFQWTHLQALFREERGSAYTLSYVLCFPVYMLLVCLVIQTSLVLLVKIGTVYAAYASGRAGIVWLNATPDLAAQKIRQAASNAMTPFASSNSTHLARLGGAPGLSTTTSFQVYRAYQEYASNPRATRAYLDSKVDLAAVATDVNWSPKTPSGNEDVTLTLTYRMPLHIPGAARILGYSSGICPIESTVVLQNEGAKRVPGQDPKFPLGIDYRSDR